MYRELEWRGPDRRSAGCACDGVPVDHHGGASAPVTRLLLVEGRERFAESVASVLEHEGYVVERPLAPRSDAVLARAQQFRPHIVLLDSHLGDGQTSLSLIRPLREVGAVVLMLGGQRTRRALAECVEAGAVGFVHRSASLIVLLAAVWRASATGTALSGRDRAELRQPRPERRVVADRRSAPFDDFTAREREVMRAMMSGMSASSIADRDCVSVATVRSQIRAVLNKLGVKSQMAAVALARASNWSSPGTPAPADPQPHDRERTGKP